MSQKDYYTVTSASYYLLIIGTLLYAACFIAFLVLIQNANVTNTVLAPNYPWGEYVSLLYASAYWLALFLSCWRILLVPSIQFLILFRKTRWCSIMWLVIIFLITLIDLLVIVSLGKLYGACNGVGQQFNPCNDPNYCCASEIYSQPNSGCTNTIACPASFPSSISGLYANVDFVWLFFTSLGFLVGDLIFLIYFMSMFYVSPSVEDEENDPLPRNDDEAALNIQRKLRGKIE